MSTMYWTYVMFCDVSMIKIFIGYVMVERTISAGKNYEGVLMALPSKSKPIVMVPTF